MRCQGEDSYHKDRLLQSKLLDAALDDTRLKGDYASLDKFTSYCLRGLREPPTYHLDGSAE